MRTTFEGEHRSGKGTQIELYQQKIATKLLVVRGDGSYQGGLEGIVSKENIAFRHEINNKLYQEKPNEKVIRSLWSIAATLCAITIVDPVLQDRDLLIDRGPLSRASYLISQGLSGNALLQNMYPEFEYMSTSGYKHSGPVNVEAINFGRIIYISVPASVLLERVVDDDPKAEFRKKNIREKEGLFDKAIQEMPRSIQSLVEIVDGNKLPEDVLSSYTNL